MNISVENGPPEQVRSTNYNRLCVARDKGKSFVANHLRDVVYKSDLDLALRMSLTSFDPRHEDDSPFSLKEANSVAARKVVLAYVELMLDLLPFEVEVEVREQREENLREYLLRLRRYLKNQRFVGVPILIFALPWHIFPALSCLSFFSSSRDAKCGKFSVLASQTASDFRPQIHIRSSPYVNARRSESFLQFKELLL